MSGVSVLVPEDFFDGATEVVVANWLYQDGEAVAQGSVIAELMAEKATFELEAPASGVLRVLIGEEKPISVAQPIANIE